MSAVGSPITPPDPLYLLPQNNVPVTIGTLVPATAITGVTLASGVYTVTSTAHGLTTGQTVTIASVVFTGSAPGPNGTGLVVTKTGANTFTVAIAGAGTFTYTSGGTVTETIADTTALSMFNCGQFNQVTIGSTAGNLYLQGIGDAAPVLFQVGAFQVLYGKWQAVGNATTGSTAGLYLVCSL